LSQLFPRPVISFGLLCRALTWLKFIVTILADQAGKPLTSAFVCDTLPTKTRRKLPPLAQNKIPDGLPDKAIVWRSIIA
jgi:hypothetical protein